MNDFSSNLLFLETRSVPVPVGLSALVVTHNRKAQLRQTLDRLLAEQVDVIVVVNNASTDGTTAMLLTITDPRLQVINLPRNMGGAGGFEAGLRAMVAWFDPEWCVLMDDDSRPESGTFARFQDQSEQLLGAGYDAIASGVFYPDGRICEMNRPSRNPFWHVADFIRTALGQGRSGFHLRDADYAATAPVQVDASSFVGLFLSRQGLARAGYPDGELFLYADDVMYTLRLTQRGGRIGFLPELRFEHDCTTYPVDGSGIHRPLWKVYYNYRNALRAYRMVAGPVLFWPVLALTLFKWRRRARHAGSDRDAYLTLLNLAVKDALWGHANRDIAQVRALARSLRRDG
jgi:GT2 family glycosyltransferase